MATTRTKKATKPPTKPATQRAAPKKKVLKAPTKKASAPAEAAAGLIDARIADLDDWRGETLARLRALIHAAVPGVVEEWKWGIPVWSKDGILCTGEVYKAYVKATFAHGAALPDPAGLFNASLGGGTRRAIDFREGAWPSEKALKELLRAAAAFNASKR